MTTPLTAADHTHSRALDQAAIRCFHDHGYALPGQQLLPAHEFTDLQGTFNRLHDTWITNGGRPEHMDVPHFYFPELNHWLLHPKVLDVVEDLIGPDIALYSSHFVCKPAGDGKRVPWHEDSAYWKKVFTPGPGQTGDGMEVVTIWLAIDPSTPDNGCMQVIPDSHHHGYSDYELIDDPEAVFTGNIKRNQVDEERAVPCILQAGEYSLHHAKTIHGSARNTSTQRRCGYTMRYVTTRSRYLAEHSYGKHHALYLARGVDHAGNTYADPSLPNQAWIDAHGFFIPIGH